MFQDPFQNDGNTAPNINGAAQQQYVNDIQAIRIKAGLLTSALNHAGIPSQTTHETGDLSTPPAQRPSQPHIDVAFRDASGIEHYVTLYGVNQLDEHRQYYKRTTAFDVQPAPKEWVAKNPALSLDSLRRSGLRADIMAGVDEQSAPAMLVSLVDAGFKNILPGILSIAVSDPVTRTVAQCRTVVPSDLAPALAHSTALVLKPGAHVQMRPHMVFSATLPQNHKLSILPCFKSDQLHYGHPDAIYISGGVLSIKIQKEGFRDYPLAVETSTAGFEAAFRNSAFAPKYDTVDHKRVSDIIDELPAIKGRATAILAARPT